MTTSKDSESEAAEAKEEKGQGGSIRICRFMK
jgi:hypothetical protein